MTRVSIVFEKMVRFAPLLCEKDHTFPPLHFQCKNAPTVIQVAQYAPSPLEMSKLDIQFHMTLNILVKWTPRGMPPHRSYPFYPFPHN